MPLLSLYLLADRFWIIDGQVNCLALNFNTFVHGFTLGVAKPSRSIIWSMVALRSSRASVSLWR